MYSEIYKKSDLIKQGRTLSCFSFTSVDSTNNEAKRLIRKGEIGSEALIIARGQTCGRGRYERIFQSPFDKGAYLSYVRCVDAEADYSVAGAVCALSVCDAVRTLTGAECSIKWPNDVKLNGVKLCGILPENVAANGKRYLILGVGVNVLRTREELADLPFKCASLLSETSLRVNIRSVIEEVAFNIADMLDTAFSDKIEFAARYRNACETIGQRIKFGENLSRRGNCVGTDENCNLLINENGNIIKLNWGEITSADNV